MVHTISCKERDSFSGVTMVLWIKNLSLHFAERGGSSFIACSITWVILVSSRKAIWILKEGWGTHQILRQCLLVPPYPSLVGHSTATWTGLVNWCGLGEIERRGTFGAVVLTLKATGEALWLAIVSVRLTTAVRGP